jgi:hypothetical protein
MICAALAARELKEEDDGASASSATAAPAAKDSSVAAQLAEAEAGVKLREASAAFHRGRARAAQEQAHLDAKAAELQAAVETREAHLGEVSAAFRAYKREVSRGAAHSVTGKRIPRELLDRYGAEEAEVDAALARAELKFAAASAALKESRERAAAAEELGHASSSALDVDQLRVEIGSLRERIDGTADEIEKMRRKSAVAVQVITHVREKLHSVRRAREAPPNVVVRARVPRGHGQRRVVEREHEKIVRARPHGAEVAREHGRGRRGREPRERKGGRPREAAPPDRRRAPHERGARALVRARAVAPPAAERAVRQPPK